jgi:hypothetical protein
VRSSQSPKSNSRSLRPSMVDRRNDATSHPPA